MLLTNHQLDCNARLAERIEEVKIIQEEKALLDATEKQHQQEKADHDAKMRSFWMKAINLALDKYEHLEKESYLGVFCDEEFQALEKIKYRMFLDVSNVFEQLLDIAAREVVKGIDDHGLDFTNRLRTHGGKYLLTRMAGLPHDLDDKSLSVLKYQFARI
jgi:hypothetical protein